MVILLTVATIGFAGVFAALGYLAPILEDEAGFSDASAVWGLALFGLGLTAGNLLAPALQRRIRSERHSTVLVLRVLVTLVGVLVLFAVTATVPALAVVDVFLVGVVGFSLVPLVQARLLDEAGGAPTLASAAMHSAFNAGNALGPLVGGLAIGGALGNAAAPAAGAGLTALGLGIAVVGLLLRPGVPAGLPT